MNEHQEKIIRLKQKQSMPLSMKVKMSIVRIRSMLSKTKGMMYVSFSGGKDSMVLMHLVKQVSKTTPVVYINTGVEWPSVHKIAMKYADHVISPSMKFSNIIEKYGYPAISKETAQKLYEIRTTKSEKLLHKRLYGDEKGRYKIPEKWKFMIDSPFLIGSGCCDVLKKRPVKKYEKETGRGAFIGTLAQDSQLRMQAYLNAGGCNAIDGNGRIKSTPLSFWLRSDIDQYLKDNHLDVASIYENVRNTGCVFCLFGCHFKGWNNIEVMRRFRKGMYNQAEKLGMIELNKYIRANGHPRLF